MNSSLFKSGLLARRVDLNDIGSTRIQLFAANLVRIGQFPPMDAR